MAPMMHGAAMWSSLISLYAGQAVVVSDQHHFDAEHIWDIVERDGVNIISLVGDAMALPLVKALEAHPGRWNLDRLMVVGMAAPCRRPSCGSASRLRCRRSRCQMAWAPRKPASWAPATSPRRARVSWCLRRVLTWRMMDDDLRYCASRAIMASWRAAAIRPLATTATAKRAPRSLFPRRASCGCSAATMPGLDARATSWCWAGVAVHQHRGRKVFPDRVEEGVRRYAAVADVLVGLPDERWGQKMAAVIEVASGQDFDRARIRPALPRKPLGLKPAGRLALRAQQADRAGLRRD